MCLSPGILADGQLVGCRKCWQCQARRTDDWVGRCIAESLTAKACNFVTLTYGQETRIGGADHERTAVLTYSDVQKFIKKVRKDGFRVKYFAAGEFGSEKGRAHWHLLIYWLDQVPDLTLNKRMPSKWWADADGNTLGFVRWERLTPKSVRYACKYLQKDIGKTDRQGYFAMSKKPPLGSEYFERRAAKFVEQGLAPQDLKYSWPNVRDKDGSIKQFCLGYNSAVRFIRAYVAKFIEVFGNDHYPDSPLVDEWRDRDTRAEVRQDDYVILKRHNKTRTEYPFLKPPHDVEVEWSTTRLHWIAWDPLDGTEWFWSFDDEGKRAWTQAIVVESDAERKRGSNANSSERQSEYRQKSGSQFEPRLKPLTKREKRRMRDRQFLTK